MDMHSLPDPKPAQAQAALRQLADLAQMLVWMTDANDDVVYLNQGSLARLEQSEPVQASTWLEFVHPDDRACVGALVRQAKGMRAEYQVEYRIIKSDGSIRRMMSSAAPRFAADGDLLGYNGSITDVSDRHQAGEELGKREARFRSLTNLLTDWYWETDEDDRFTFASEGVERLFGTSPELIIGKSRHDLAVYLNQPGMMECFAKIAQRQPFKDIRYATNWSINGVMRHASLSGEPVFDDGIFKGYRGVGRDITEEVEVAEKLAQLAAENKALIENSLDMLAVFNSEGRILRVNEASREIIGYEPEELLGRRHLEFVVPEEQERTRAIALSLRSDKNTVQNFQNRWIRKDGSIVHLSWAVRRAKDHGLTYATARDITESYRTQAELRKSKDRLSSMLESIGDAFFAVNRDWRITYVNRRTAEFVSRTQDELIGKIAWEAVPEMRHSSVFPYYRDAMESRIPAFFETYYEPADAWIEVRAYPYEDGLSVFFHDVSERRAAGCAIRDSEQRFRELIEMTPAGYILADAQGSLVAVNPALCHISGYTQEELIGRSLAELFPDCPCDGALSVQGGASSVHAREAAIKHKQGHLAYVLINAVIKRDAEGNGMSVTAFLTDITERKQAESRLEQLATHDTLTGLPNRALLNERVQQLLESAPRNESITVMFIDLDRFKEVNDSLGHEPGDMLLREVGRRLQRNLRPNDIVARLGGDEFVVVAHCSQGSDSAERIVEKLFAALAAPVDIAGQEVFIGASIGISMFPQDGTTKEVLFQNADTAMYRAKAAGRKTYRFFEEEMSVEAKTRMTLEHSLRRALDGNQFELHYQPRIHLKTMAIVGMEALIRWNHPQLGQVSPMQFIPMAEEKGLIEPIGRWVLDEACMQTRRLMDKYKRSLCVSVNLSARQLKSRDILGQVHASLKNADLAPHLLELELTESALIEDIEMSAGVLKELKKLGILLSVDDFGTGYSGLAYLRRFPLDTLKLDRSFVTQHDDGISSFKFIKAFVDLAHSLNLSVVAEGVETNETLQFLREAACDEAQGYLLARPLSLEAFEAYLSRLPNAEVKGKTA
jgi:diguanylate cyclase (GGDEF)-like protein/PAS domain S-box-containing protein